MASAHRMMLSTTRLILVLGQALSWPRGRWSGEFVSGVDYELLGVKRDATAAEIKSAYRPWPARCIRTWAAPAGTSLQEGLRNAARPGAPSALRQPFPPGLPAARREKRAGQRKKSATTRTTSPACRASVPMTCPGGTG